MTRKNLEEILAVSFCFILPTILIAIGLIFFPYPVPQNIENIMLVFAFSGLILLGFGFFYNDKKKISSETKILGWSLFAIYWSTKPSTLYFYEGGDVFNAALCIVGIYVLFYFAYHEWLSIKRNEISVCLNWLAGIAFITGIIYMSIDNIFISAKNWLIETVASQSCWVLNIFNINTIREGTLVYYKNYPLPVNIIFACTAIQSILLFVGLILTLQNVSWRKKIISLATIVPTVYILNLFRNAMVIYLGGEGITSFEFAHNVIGKGGSLLALIILVYLLFKYIPEIYDNLMCVFYLPKRKGPLEKIILKHVRKG
ncbi:MAG: archaeosortase A [Thermoplasmata archaeon]|nr:archaeosortase A [Thermoplasmata archaeon]